MKSYLVYKNQMQGVKDVSETVKTVEKIAASSVHFLKQEVSNLNGYAAEVDHLAAVYLHLHRAPLRPEHGGVQSAVPGGLGGADGVLYVGSMEGELVSASISTRNPLWPGVSLGAVERSGGFGCAPASTAVAIYGTPTVSGNLVYVAGYDGRVRAVNADLGRR